MTSNRVTLNVKKNQFQWTLALDEELAILLIKNISYAQIARQFKTWHSVISRRAIKLGIVPDSHFRNIEQRELNKQGLKKCCDCKNVFPRTLEYFYALRSGYCKQCERNRMKKSYQNMDITKAMRRSLRRIKAKCIQKNIPFNLTSEYLEKLYKRQKGICFYSGSSMELCKREADTNRHKIFSVDRIDPTGGYIKGNIVFCTWLINAMKLDSSKDNFLRLCANVTNYCQRH